MSDAAPTPDADKSPGNPHGKSLGWTEADIDALSAVGPNDVPAADAAFKRLAPKGYKGLLRARKNPER